MAASRSFRIWKPLARFSSSRAAFQNPLFCRAFQTSSVFLQLQGDDSQNIQVHFKSGFPVVTVPLPSRRELCQFTLRPLSESVKDFIENVKEEDGGIERVAVYDPSGSRISGSTKVDVLMKSNFKLVINDVEYDVKVPDTVAIAEDDQRSLAHVKTLIHQLYSSMNIEEHQLQKEEKLLSKLEEIKADLQPMEKLKSELNDKAAKRANFLVWGGLGFMAVQFGLLARLTWWEYSWDIMEPVTYFVGYGTAMACYAYFVITRQEYLYPDARDRQHLLAFHKLSKKKSFDVEKYNHLKDCMAKIEEDLKELRSPYKLHLPTRITEKIADK
ncbi:predicted protein [Nematostella vectensis]|uniref:Calcium uniporter protein n=1 Tax=Nematostella vectensis TaxID=45351 RepID=A7SWC7_NEMVE|nr:calcium uniporter protein, mitochondrial [Nematostella vectensis]EDO31988.1 predicted protein [Nematostella vectensis]|eukprot:XP_001624088.1 predicted protein [Nematostella vectensis]